MTRNDPKTPQGAAWRGPLPFLLAEGGLYLLFLGLDLFRGGEGAAPVKYLSIALCAAAALLWARRGGCPLTACALVLTLGADTFLLLLDRWYFLGVALFFGVQALYALRLCRAGAGLHLAERALIWGALTLALLLLGLLTPLNAAAALYLACFLVNLRLSRSLPGVRGRQLFWGLALYLCCDFWVGVFNYPTLFPASLAAFSRVGMWLFYLPGQALLALSGRAGPPVEGE